MTHPDHPKTGRMDISACVVDAFPMTAVRLVCTVRGHRWRRFREEGVDMRECLRCGQLVGRDADPPPPIKMG